MEPSERQLALLALLGRSRRPVARAEIEERVDGYRAGSGEAVRKMIQRDIGELQRHLGITVEYVTGAHPGYRVTARGPAEIDLNLAKDEAAALAIAIAGAADVAGASLEAAADLPLAAHAGWVLPAITIDARCAQLLDAITTGRPVMFRYRDRRGHESDRRVHPYRLPWRGEWYLIAHDLDRGALRHFRLRRIQGEVNSAGETGSFSVPDGIVATVNAPFEQDPDRTAELLVDPAIEFAIRRRFRADPEVDDAGARFRIPYRDDAAFAAFLAGFGDQLVVLGPASLREAMVTHLGLVAHAAGEGR